MVKNVSTIDRSNRIRIGKNVPDDQPLNTVIINASDEVISPKNIGTFISPIRKKFDLSNVLTYDSVTKEILDSGAKAHQIQDLESVISEGNVTSNTVEFLNPDTAFVTASKVGISNTNPLHLLDVGDNFYVDNGGDVLVGGNLTVLGDTTLVSSENLSIKDAIIELGKDNVDDDFVFDLGIILNRPSSNVAVGFKETSNEFIIGYTQSSANDRYIVPETSNLINVRVYGDITANSFTGDGSLLSNTAQYTDIESNVLILRGEIDSNTSILRDEMEANTATLRSDLQSNVTILRDEMEANTVTLRSDLQSNVTILRDEMEANTVTLRSDLQSNVTILRDEMEANTVTLRSDIQSNVTILRDEMEANTVTLRSDLQSNVTILRDEMETNTVTLRSDLQSNVTILRDEIDSNLATARTDLQSNVTVLRSEIDSNLATARTDLQSNVTVLRGEIDSNLATVRADLQSNVSILRDEMEANTISTRNELQSNLALKSNIESPIFTGVITGDGGGISNVTLQQVTQYGNTSSNTIELTNSISLVTSGYVGINTPTPESTLHVAGDILADGDITAVDFYGNSFTTRSLTIEEDMTVLGDLDVYGNTTYISTRNLFIEDPILGLGNNNSISTLDTGIILLYNGYSNVAIGYKGAENRFIIGYTSNTHTDSQIIPDTSNSLDVRIYGDVTANAYLGDGGLLSNIAANLQDITDNGNVTSNTVQFTNPDAGIVATGNIQANYFVGDGSLLSNVINDTELASNISILRGEIDSNLATARTDLQSNVTVLRGEIDSNLATARTDLQSNVTVLRGEIDSNLATARTDLQSNVTVLRSEIDSNLATARSDLQSNVTVLRSEIDSNLATARTDLQSNVTVLRSEIDSNLATARTDLQSNVTVLRGEIDSNLATARTDLQSNVTVLRSEIDSNLATARTDLQSNVTVLRGEIDSNLATARTDLQSNVTVLRGEIDSNLATARSDLQSNVTVLRGEIDSNLATARSDLQSNVTVLRGEIDSNLATARTDLQSNVTVLRSEIDSNLATARTDLQSNVTVLRGEIDSNLATARTDLQSNVTVLRGEIDSNLATARSDLQSNVTVLRGEIDSNLATARSDLQSNVTVLRSEIDSNLATARTDLQSNVTVLRSEIDSNLATARTDLQSNVTVLRGEIDSNLATARTDLQSNVTVLRSEIDSNLATARTDLQSNVTVLRGEIDSNLATARTDLQSNVTVLRGEIDSNLATARSDLQSNVTVLRGEIDSNLATARSDLQSNVTVLRGEIDSNLATTRTDLQSNVTVLRSEIDSNLATARTDLQSNVTVLRGEIDSNLATARTDLQSNVTVLRGEIDSNLATARTDLQSNVTVLRGEIDSNLATARTDLQSNVTVLRSEIDSNLATARTDLQSNVTVLRGEIDSNLATARSDLQSNVTVLRGEIDSNLATARSDLQSNVTVLRGEIDSNLATARTDLQSNVTVLRSEIDSNLATARTDLQSNVTVLRGEIDSNLATARTDLQSNVTVLRGEIDSNLATARSDLQSNVTVLRGEIDSNLATARSDLQSNVTVLRSEIDSNLATARTDLQSNVTVLRSEIDSNLATARTDLQSNVTVLRGEIDSNLATARTDLQSNVTVLRSEIDSNLATARTDLQSNVTVLRGEIDSNLATARTDLQSNVTVLRGEIDSNLATARSDLQSNVTVLRGEIDSNLATARSDLQSNVTVLRGEIDSNLATTRTDLQSNVTVLRSEIDSNLATARTDLQSNVTVLRGEIDSNLATARTDLQSNVTVLRGEIDSNLATARADLQSNVTVLRSEIDSNLATARTDLQSNVTILRGEINSNVIDLSGHIQNLQNNAVTFQGTKTFENDVILESNLRINGDLMVANTINMIVSDPIIELGANNLNTGDLGIVMTRHGVSESNVAIVYDESADILRLGYTLNSANDTTIELDSNYMPISIQGNVGIRTSSPTYALDVHGTANVGALTVTSVSGDGSGLSQIQSSNVSDFVSNVARIENLETSNGYIWSNLASNVTILRGEIDSNLATARTDLQSNVTILRGEISRANTINFSNVTTGLTVDSNVIVSGNVTADRYLGDGGLLSNIESVRKFTLSTNGSSDYIFSGPGFDNPVNDPIIILSRGFTYIFDNTSNYTIHPFKIRLNNGGPNYTNGVIDDGFGTTTFNVPMDAPTSLYYQCSVHSSMGNIIKIVDNLDTNETLILSNTTTGLSVSSNVLVTGNVTADYFMGDGSNLSGIVTDLQSVTDNGNVTSNTVQFTNPTTSFVTSSNIGISNTNPQHTLDIGDKLYVDTNDSNVLSVDGNIVANKITLGTISIYAGNGGSGTGIDTTQTLNLTNPTTGLTVDSNVVVGGNVTADYFVGDGSNLTGISGSVDTTQTLALSNVTTGLTVDSNVVVGGNVTTDTLRSTNVFINNVRLLASTGLQQVTNVSNTTSNTISLTNPTTGLTVDSNVVVGGNVTTDTLRSTNVFINNVRLLASTGLQQVTNVSNTTSNTISLTNPTTGLTVDSNVVVGGNVTTDTLRSTNVFINNVRLLASTGLQQVTNVSNTTSNTISLTNPTTGLTVDSNVVVGGNVTTDTLRSTNVFINNVRLLASTGLQQVTNVSNTTSNTISLTNPTTGLTVDSNVVVGGNVTADYFVGDGSNLTGISGGLDTSQTLGLTNPTTGLTVDSNVVVGGNVTTDTLRSTNVFINNVRLLASTGLQQVTNVSNTTSNTISLTNPTTGLTVDSNVVVGGNVTTDTLRSTNVFINNVRLLASTGLQQVTNVSNTTSNTISLTNPTTGLTVDSNVVVGGNVTTDTLRSTNVFINNVRLLASTGLQQVTNVSNTTSNTISLTNPTTGLTVDSNVVVGGNVTADYFVGDGSNLTGISGGLDTSQTLGLTNPTTGLTVDSNVVVGGNVTTDTLRSTNVFINNVRLLASTGLQQVTNVSNTTSNTISLTNPTTGLTVDSNVVVGGNVTTDTLRSTNVFINNVRLLASTGLQQVTNVSNTTSNTISLTNPTTGLTVDSNVVVGGNVTTDTLRSTNVFINNVRLLASTGLQQVTNVSNTTSNTISLTNPTTGLTVDSNVVVGGNVTTDTLRSTNVFINNVRLLASTGLQQVTNVSNTTSNTISLTNPTTGLTVDSNVVVGGNVTTDTLRSTNVFINNVRLLASTGLQQVTNVSNTTSNTISLTNPTTGLTVDSNVVVGGNVTTNTLHSTNVFINNVGLLASAGLQQVTNVSNTTSNTISLTNPTTGLTVDSNVVVGGFIIGDGRFLSNVISTIGNESYNQFGLSTSYSPGGGVSHNDYLNAEAVAGDNGNGPDISANLVITSGFTKIKIELDASVTNYTDPTTEIVIALERTINGSNVADVKQFVFPAGNNFFGSQYFLYIDTHGATTGDIVEYKLRVDMSSYNNESARIQYGICGDCLYIKELK
jgi:hypothetical protein